MQLQGWQGLSGIAEVATGLMGASEEHCEGKGAHSDF